MSDLTGGTSLARRAWTATRRAFDRSLRMVVRLLGARVPDDDEPAGPRGRWPTTRRLFLWNVLLTKSAAPRQDGASPPRYDPSRDGDPEPPEWVDRVPDELLDQAVESTRAAHLQARERIEQVELKASRLLTPIISLVAGAVAVAAFDLNRHADGHTSLYLVGGVLAAAAVLLLLAAAISTLDADVRIGFYRAVDGEDIADGAAKSAAAARGQRGRARHDHARLARHLLSAEAIAAEWTGWSATKKINLVMQARAWLSRGLAMLLIALVFSGLALVRSEPAQNERTPGPEASLSASPTPSPTASRLPSIPATPSPSLSSAPTVIPSVRPTVTP